MIKFRKFIPLIQAIMLLFPLAMGFDVRKNYIVYNDLLVKTVTIFAMSIVLSAGFFWDVFMEDKECFGISKKMGIKGALVHMAPEIFVVALAGLAFIFVKTKFHDLSVGEFFLAAIFVVVIFSSIKEILEKVYLCFIAIDGPIWHMINIELIAICIYLNVRYIFTPVSFA